MFSDLVWETNYERSYHMAHLPMKFGLGNLRRECILADHLACGALCLPSGLYISSTLCPMNRNVLLELRNNRQFANTQQYRLVELGLVVFHAPIPVLIHHIPDNAIPKNVACLC